MPDGDGYCLCTTMNVKLLQDMLDMVADGVGGSYEALSNVARAEALRQVRRNLSFARSELFEQRSCVILGGDLSRQATAIQSGLQYSPKQGFKILVVHAVPEKIKDERVFVFGLLLVDDAHIQSLPVTLAGKSSHVIIADRFALGHRVCHAAEKALQNSRTPSSSPCKT